MRNGRIRALNLNLKIGFFNINAQYDNHHPQYTQLHNTLHMTLEGDTQLPRLQIARPLCKNTKCYSWLVQFKWRLLVAGVSHICACETATWAVPKKNLNIQHWDVPSGPPRKSNLDLVPHASSNPTWPNLNQLVREKTTKQEHNCSVCYELQWVCDVEKNYRHPHGDDLFYIVWLKLGMQVA